MFASKLILGYACIYYCYFFNGNRIPFPIFYSCDGGGSDPEGKSLVFYREQGKVWFSIAEALVSECSTS